MNTITILRSAALFCLWPIAATAAISFSVSPATVSNTYSGTLTLLVSGLTNGETVRVQKYLDMNSNGVLDTGDLLWQQFQLTDGQSTVLGGVTNLNVPGDTDSTAGQITAPLRLQNDFAQLVVGKYLFILSSPGAHFAPLTNAFTVTNFAFAQQFSGNVVNNGTNVPNALLILLQPSAGGGNPQGGVVANSAGAYSIRVPPGQYTLVPVKTNFVSDMRNSPNLSLGSGQAIVTNLNSLLVATQSITGRLVDANNTSLGLPGLLLPMTSKASGSYLSLCCTDPNGYFTARVITNLWGIEPSDQGVNAYGYLRPQNSYKVDTGTGSVAGVTMSLPKATALFYGSVKDSLGNPLTHVQLSSSDQTTYLYEDGGVFSDPGGNYFAGALGGATWQANISGDSNPGFTNYVFSQGIQTSLSVGQAYHCNFSAIFATNHLNGNVQFNGNPVAGARVNVSASLNGTQYGTRAYTDANGNYWLNVPNGTWSVSLSCQGGNGGLDDILGPGNYQCPSGQSVVINGNNGVANFMIQPPAATGTLFGYLTDNSANPIAGVHIHANGSSSSTTTTDMSGYYTFNLSSGTWDVSADCGDLTALGYSCPSDQVVNVAGGGFVEADFTAQLCLPLQVTTTNLPDAMVGFAYPFGVVGGFALENTGCNAPYSWSLTPGSLPLPDGMVLSYDGILSGSPTSTGTNYFSLRVTDAAANTADQLLSVVVWSMVQITNSALPNAIQDVAYNAQLGAQGGQGGYYGWYIASGALPPGLNISDGAYGLGVISGTPTLQGTFSFTVATYDGSGYSPQRSYSITVQPPSVTITTTTLPNATAGMPYLAQLQASGGTSPYSWSLAAGSQPLPAGLTLSTNGAISGVPALAGTNSFIVRVTDAVAATTTRSLALIVNSGLTLQSPYHNGTRFQVQLRNAQPGTNYTLLMKTNLSAATWTGLFTTNATTSALLLTDPYATNPSRVYRVKVGP